MALSDEDALALLDTPPAPDPEPLVNESAVKEDGSIDWLATLPETKHVEPSAWGDVLRGIDNLQAVGGGLTSLIGNVSGMDSVEDWGMEVYQRNQAQAQRNPAAIGSFENIEGGGDVLTYAREAVLENLPMFAPSMATGGAGGLIGRRAATTIVNNMAESMGAEAAAKLIAKRVFIGSTLGSYASSAAMESGSIFADTAEETGVRDPAYAVGAGLVAGALDAIPEGKLLQNILGPKMGKEVVHGLTRRMGTEGAKQFLREAPTEAIQTIVEQSAIVHADPSRDLFDDDNIKGYIDAFLKGGLAGGAMGAAGEALNLRPHPDSLVREKEKDLESRANEQAPPIEQETEEGLEPESITETDQRISALHEELVGLEEDEVKFANDPEQLRVVGAIKAARELELRGLEAGLVAEAPLVNETTPTVEGEAPLTPAATDLPSYNFPKAGPLPEAITKEIVDAKREEAFTQIDALVNEKDDQVEAPAYTTAVKEAVEPYLNFITGENVKIRKAPKGDSFQVTATPKGGIEIAVPTLGEWSARNKRQASRGQATEGVESIPALMQHEVVHAAHYAYLRDQWGKVKSRKKDPFDLFVEKRMKEVGRWFTASHKGLAPELQAVYPIPPKEAKESDKDYQDRVQFNTGTEMMRMMVERARTGKLQEDISAQHSLAKRGGIATQAYNAVIKAVQRIKQVLDKYISPETSTPGIQKIYREVNAVLDKYGIIRPDPVKPVSEAEPRLATEPESVPTPEPEREAEVSLVNEKERVAASRRKQAESAERRSGLTEARGELASKIRQHRTTGSPETAKAAAIQHARIRLKEGELKTKTDRVKARQDFEVTLQGKFPQARYDEAITEARGKPIERQAARALPESDIPSTVAESLGITYDGEAMDKFWQFTDTNEESPSYGTTFNVPIGATEERITSRYREVQQSYIDAPATVTEDTLDEAIERARDEGPRLNKTAEVQLRGADNKRAFEMLGQSMYSRDLPKTVGKEVFQNAVDAILSMGRPEGEGVIIAGSIYKSGGGPQPFVIGDNGPGMSLETILDKFLPAFVSGKEVGQGGGFGLAKLAFLGGPESWRVVTINEDASGKRTKVSLTGTGKGYIQFASEPPKVNLTPGIPIRLSDELILKYDFVEDLPTGTAMEFIFKEGEDSWGAIDFVTNGKKFIKGIKFGTSVYKGNGDPGPMNELGYRHYEPDDAVDGDWGVIHSVSLPEADVDVIAINGSKLGKVSWFNVPILNRSILQFSQQFRMEDEIVLPSNIAVNIKPKTRAGTADYPFSTNRESLTDRVAKEVQSFFRTAGEREAKKMRDRYNSAITDAPVIKGSKLRLLDAGGGVPETLVNEIAKNPLTLQVSKDIGKIQNAILDVLEDKFGGKFGRATYKGLITGGRAYGVHFGKSNNEPSSIYHDPWLTWQFAKDEAVSLVNNAAKKERGEKPEDEDAVIYVNDEAKPKPERPLSDKEIYATFLAKVAGISFHEALHQKVSTEGESLARELTFKAGDIISTVVKLISPKHTNEKLAAITAYLDETGERLKTHIQPDEAVSFNAAHGYSGYALKEQGPTERGTPEGFDGGDDEVTRPSLAVSRRSPELNALDRESSAHLDKIFSPIALVNERVRRGRMGGRLRFWDFTGQELEYMSQPKDPTFFAAKDFMDEKGGIAKTADFLLTNKEVAGTSLYGGEKTALYQLVMMGLERMRTTLAEEPEQYDAEDADWVDATLDQIDLNYGLLVNELGKMTSNTKGHERFITGRRTRKDYVSAITQQWKKKFRGDKSKDMLSIVSSKLNKVAQDAVGKVVTRPEAVAFFRKVLKDLNSKEWQKEMRKTIATKSRKIKGIARKLASRAAQDEFATMESEPALMEAVRRIVSDMTFGIPKQDNPESSRSILSEAINSVVREIAREEGAVTPRKQRTKITELQKLSEILKNDELYEQFVMELEDRMVTKFGGSQQGPAFMEAINRLTGRLRGRTWMNGLLEGVVNEKMAGIKTSIEKVAKQTYGEGRGTIEEVKKAIRKELQDNGIDNPLLLDQMGDDLDAMMEKAVEDARELWAGEPGAVRKTLREIGLTVQKVAKSGFRRRDEIAQDMAAQFVERLGLSNTGKFRHADRLKIILQKAMAELVDAERERIIENTLLKTQHPDLVSAAKKKGKGQRLGPVERLVEYANMGALDDEQVYNALAEELKMPLVNEKDAKRIQEWGEMIGNMPPGRERTIELLKLSNFLESRKGVDWKDMLVAGMYSSMLSGPSTQAVNIVSNFLNLMGMVYTEGVRAAWEGDPARIANLFRAMMIGFTRGGALEFKQTLRTGLSAGKLNQKVEGGNPLEYENPIYLDPVASTVGSILSLTRAKYVVRALQATDMMFYKAAQEVAFTSRTGYTGNGDQWRASVTETREELRKAGVDVDSRDGRRQVESRALQNFERWRELGAGDSSRAEEFATAWNEAHGDALTITFNQEPKGWIGQLATTIANYTSDYPLAKVIIPFTRVVANVLNTQIEWSPVGLGRWAFAKQFRLEDADGVMKRDPRLLIRALTGTLALGGLSMLLARYDDEEDPYFTIYGSGPKDANRKRQLYEIGWKPNTIKIGDKYISYLPTPMSLGLASLGTLMDRHRDDPESDLMDRIPQLGLSFLQGALNQSFLTGVADLFSAFDSPDPEAKMQRILARTVTIPVPNLLKQIDAWVDPSVQQADSFLDMVIKQVPVARLELKPMLNVFGQPVERTQGPLNIPFSNRFVTIQKTDDPVFSFIGANQLSVPSYSKQTKLKDEPMTGEQYYEYVKKAGPQIYEALRREIPSLRNSDKEAQQERIDEIAQDIKRRTRDQMKRAL